MNKISIADLGHEPLTWGQARGWGLALDLEVYADQHAWEQQARAEWAVYLLEEAQGEGEPSLQG